VVSLGDRVVVQGRAVPTRGLMTASWLANAAARASRSNMDTNTGVAPCVSMAYALAAPRTNVDAVWLAPTSAGTAYLPMAPVPPVTKTRIANLLVTRRRGRRWGR
jgi:hypothetical protein